MKAALKWSEDFLAQFLSLPYPVLMTMIYVPIRSYGYHRRPNSLSLFQKIVVDVFMSIIDPYY